MSSAGALESIGINKVYRLIHIRVAHQLKSRWGIRAAVAFPTTIHTSGRRSPDQSYSGLKLPTGRVPGLVLLRRTTQDAVRQQAVQEGGGGLFTVPMSVCIVLRRSCGGLGCVLYISDAANAQHPSKVLYGLHSVAHLPSSVLQYDEKLCGLLENYEKCFIVHADNVGSRQFMDIRRVCALLH